MDWTWVNVLVVGLLLLFVVSRFLKFPLPKERDVRRRSGSLGKKGFGHLSLEDLKMPEMRLTDESEPKPADRRLAVWDPERLKLGAGLEGVAKLAAIDPTFEEKTFLAMLRELVVRYYALEATRDEAKLVAMCAPVQAGRVLNAWRAKGWKPRPLEKLEEVSILSTRTAGRTAIVEASVRLKVQGGARTAGQSVEERWVVARPFTSEDPTWEIERVTTGGEA